MKIYTADFETANSNINIENENTFVWLWDVCSITDLSHKTGDNLSEFFSYIEELSPAILYFHNLKFDGMFILDYLLKNGFKHTAERKLYSNEFSTLITDNGVFYSIKIKFASLPKKKAKVIEIRDSAKKISGSVADIAIAYDLPIVKGEIDYKMQRAVGYKATEKEISYIHNDTEIPARVLKIQYDDGLTKMTTSSDTFNLYKSTIKQTYSALFPCVSYEVDTYFRQSLRGGVVQVNPNYVGKIIKQDVYVYDENSMYPDKMANYSMPFGVPEYFKGEYKYDENMPLHISHVMVCMDIKDGYYPTILLNNTIFGNSNYIKNTDGQLIDLYLSSVDLDIMKRHYNIYEIKYIDGYKFYASKKLFRHFIAPIYKLKATSKGSRKELEKLKLNGLYGKFSMSPKHRNKIPYLENDVVKFRNGDVTIGEPIYTPVSIFVTAYARLDLFKAIQANYSNFIYCDTDSIHLLDSATEIEVNQTKLGAWKLEKIYKTSKYLGQKTYYGIYDVTDKETNEIKEKIEMKICGCPKNVKKNIPLNKFKIGETFSGKLMPKHVVGGIVLIDKTFTFKAR